MTNLEYENTFGGAYFMFSTFESGPVNVKIYRRNSSGTDWESSHIYSTNVSPGSPKTWALNKNKTVEFFRYATSSSKYNSSWLKTDDFGLKIVASKNIYVRVTLQPDNKGGNPQSYGKGTATHGAAFSSKGIARGAGTEFYLRSIYYDFGKFNLIKRYKPRLDSIADLLDKDLNINLLISSYTDARGSFKSNKKLSESRSKTIYNYLTKRRGIDENRLEVKDFGEEHIKGNLYSDYLVEVYRSESRRDVSNKLKEFSKYKPFIYRKKNSYLLVAGQFDNKKDGLILIRKLKGDGIASNLIKNNFTEVSKSEHQKNRKTSFKMLLNEEK